MTDIPTFGPWNTSKPPRDRMRDITVFRVLCSFECGRRHPLYVAMLRADLAADDQLGLRDEALLEAAIELERLEALKRRRLLGSYQAEVNPPAGERRERRPGHRGRYEKGEGKGAAA